MIQTLTYHLKTGLILILLLLGTFCPFNVKAQNTVDSIAAYADRQWLLIDTVFTWRTNDTSLYSRQEKWEAIQAKEQIKTIGPYTFKGIIKDRLNGEGVPFTNVFFPNSAYGTTTNKDGFFEFTVSRIPNDTLIVQALGYTQLYRLLQPRQLRTFYTIEIERSANELEEFVFKPGEDPAIRLVKRIIEHKPNNNPGKLDNYKYEVYNKLEIDLERLTKKQFENLPIPMMRKFSFIYDNLDSSEGAPFLPFYFTETLSDYYFQSNPKKTREFIKANQLKGISNESITPFLGSMYQNVNPYDNYILVMDKQFVSPISNNAVSYYNYRIKDTQEVYGREVYLLSFYPKRSGENCFTGDLWVANETYALQRINLNVSKDANINWVNDVNLYQEFAPVNDSLWFCIKDKFIAHFVAPYNARFPGFIGRKTTTYRNIVVNDTSVTNVINNPQLKQDIIVAEDSRVKNDSFWAVARHDTLGKNELAIYKMMDTLEKMPVFNTYKNMIKFFAVGVKEFGPIELGPYWYIYSNNPIEGRRFRFSMGTTPQLFKKAYLSGYLAYGTRDQELKYHGEALWILQKSPRMYVDASYTHDVDRSNSYYDRISTDNLFSNLARKPGIPWKLTMVNNTKVEFFKEYFSGFSHHLVVAHRQITPYAPLPYAGIFVDERGRPSDNVTNYEPSIRLRYAYKEKWLEGNYYRFSLGSKYPIVEARIAAGIRGVGGSSYNYQKVSLSVSDIAKVGPLGKLYFNVFAGKYFGTLPYLLLEVHPGNEFYTYNTYAFNMMNRFEFISDQYAGVILENNIGGGIFNYIPYVRKLKFRQFWTAKMLIGSLNESNRLLNLNKGYELKTLNGRPYLELGTGVENILQLFRIDFVWRILPQPLPNEPKEKHFGIFGSVKFDF